MAIIWLIYCVKRSLLAGTVHWRVRLCCNAIVPMIKGASCVSIKLTVPYYRIWYLSVRALVWEFRDYLRSTRERSPFSQRCKREYYYVPRYVSQVSRPIQINPRVSLNDKGSPHRIVRERRYRTIPLPELLGSSRNAPLRIEKLAEIKASPCRAVRITLYFQRDIGKGFSLGGDGGGRRIFLASSTPRDKNRAIISAEPGVPFPSYFLIRGLSSGVPLSDSRINIRRRRFTRNRAPFYFTPAYLTPAVPAREYP